MLQLENNNIRDEQFTVPTTHFNLQQVISQSPVAFGHDYTPSPLFSSDSAVAGPERKQYVDVYPNLYTNGAPLALTDDSLPELASGSLLSEVHDQALNGESLDPTTPQYQPYGNLQLQETPQNHQRQGYWMPTPNTPEVCLLDYPEMWTAIVRPTIGVHHRQYSNHILTLARILISI